MLRRYLSCRPFVLILGVWLLVSAARGALPAGAVVLDSDVVWDTVNEPNWVLSADGGRIAYLSKGALWQCEVLRGPPTKLADVPRTASAWMAMPEYDYARTNFNAIRAGLGNEVYNRTIGKAEESVLGLAWLRSGDGLTYGLSRRYQNVREPAFQQVEFASATGGPKTLLMIRREPFARPQKFTNFHVTADKRWVVAYSGSWPMIWDVARGRPRVTPYDYLLPSATSDRFMGIESDCRQLVIVDGDFQVRRRFDETFREGRECELVWSADERFALCRVKDEYPSPRWEGFRLNLETGEKRALKGNYFADRFQFTGRAGELVRAGIVGLRYEAVDNMVGGKLEVIPDGDGPGEMLVKFRFDPRDPTLPRMPDRPKYPLPVADSRFERFAVALPRRNAMRAGLAYHLIDRKGGDWEFPGVDGGNYITPFQVLAFVDQDRRILARSDTQLFSFPVEAITSAQETEHE